MITSTTRRLAPFAATLLLALPACAPAMSGAAAAGGPTDPEIVSIAMALNQGEVTTNQPATSKATRPEVRQFAERMVTDHSAALEQMRAIGIAAGDHPLSRQLAQSAQETAAILEQYQGVAFDRAHMSSQVELHQYALNTLDQFLIPSARNAQLRAMLQQNRALVQAHLEQARQVLNGVPAP